MRTEDLYRLTSPKMEYYRWAYAKSRRWNGKTSLEGKHVIVYCEQGFGDIIQFARYFPILREKCAKLTAHCPKQLHRLLKDLVDDFIDLGEPIPPHDCHTLSMSLPFVLNKTIIDLPKDPYIHVSEKEDLEEHEPYFKIGIAWEGNPTHSNNQFRSCPLKYFKELADIDDVRLFMVQKGVNTPEFCDDAEDIELYSVPLGDFYDTAKLINSLDLVVTVDTSILHLAGALGAPTFGMLSSVHDYRWNISKWYDSVTLLRQTEMGNWENVFDELLVMLGNQKRSDGRTLKIQQKNSMLFTGGIGDIFALESFMTDEERQTTERIFYATKASKTIDMVFDKLEFPSLSEKIVVWDDFTEKNCIYYKAELSIPPKTLPKQWRSVADWSILTKFPEIENGYRTYNESRLLKHELADISRFEIPENYVTLVPDSINDLPGRAFTAMDWAETLKFLHENNLTGVIVRTGGNPCPNHPALIDLTNQTDIFESIEILKKGKGYIGIDSCLSVLAAKLFDEILVIKTVNAHLLRWKEIYYAPKTEFDFIRPVIAFS